MLLNSRIGVSRLLKATAMVSAVIAACGGSSEGPSTTIVDAGTTETFDAAPSPQSIENCFNGVDDDGDGAIDCADADCGPIAVCVPDPTMAADFRLGTMISEGRDCPASYNGERIEVHSGLVGGGCTGCSCSASVTCSVDLYRYEVDQACPGNERTLLGTMTWTYPDEQKSSCLLGNENTGKGYASAAVVTNHPCVPQGTPTVPPPTWDNNAAFCPTGSRGGGCAGGAVCVPRARTYCVAAEGEKTCPTGFTKNVDWFKGFRDTRTCGACQCGAQTPGSCEQLAAENNAGQGCQGGAGGSIPVGGDNCNFTARDYPSHQLIGKPREPKCPGVSETSGELVGTEPVTICCQ